MNASAIRPKWNLVKAVLQRKELNRDILRLLFFYPFPSSLWKVPVINKNETMGGLALSFFSRHLWSRAALCRGQTASDSGLYILSFYKRMSNQGLALWFSKSFSCWKTPKTWFSKLSSGNLIWGDFLKNMFLSFFSCLLKNDLWFSYTSKELLFLDQDADRTVLTKQHLSFTRYYCHLIWDSVSKRTEGIYWSHELYQHQQEKSSEWHPGNSAIQMCSQDSLLLRDSLT